MTQKQEILKLIEKEKERFEKYKFHSIKRYFMINKDKRWFDGIIYGLEELECLIETEIK
jgi:hypothetical protein